MRFLLQTHLAGDVYKTETKILMDEHGILSGFDGSPQDNKNNLSRPGHGPILTLQRYHLHLCELVRNEEE